MRAHVPRTPNDRCIILQYRKDATVSGPGDGAMRKRELMTAVRRHDLLWG